MLTVLEAVKNMYYLLTSVIQKFSWNLSALQNVKTSIFSPLSSCELIKSTAFEKVQITTFLRTYHGWYVMHRVIATLLCISYAAKYMYCLIWYVYSPDNLPPFYFIPCHKTSLCLVAFLYSYMCTALCNILCGLNTWF